MHEVGKEDEKYHIETIVNKINILSHASAMSVSQTHDLKLTKKKTNYTSYYRII